MGLTNVYKRQKPENSSLLSKKNTKEIIKDPLKRPRMVFRRINQHELKKKNLKNLGSIFEDAKAVRKILISAWQRAFQRNGTVLRAGINRLGLPSILTGE